MVWFNADSDTELEKSPTAKGNATPTVNQFRACSLPLPNTKGLKPAYPSIPLLKVEYLTLMLLYRYL